jgi:hypothetical protein
VAAQQFTQFQLDAGHVEQRDGCVGLEVHQQVDVAVRPCRALQTRAEQRQARDVVMSAQRCQPFTVDHHLSAGGHKRIGGWCVDRVHAASSSSNNAPVLLVAGTAAVVLLLPASAASRLTSGHLCTRAL